MPNRSEERTEFLKDIIINFAEDYGTNSWRQIIGRTYNPDAGTLTFVELEAGEDGTEDVEWPITIETAAKGLARILSGEVGINSSMLKTIKEADEENDAGIIDAYDSDMIIQAGVFNSLVYG